MGQRVARADTDSNRQALYSNETQLVYNPNSQRMAGSLSKEGKITAIVLASATAHTYRLRLQPRKLYYHSSCFSHASFCLASLISSSVGHDPCTGTQPASRRSWTVI